MSEMKEMCFDQRVDEVIRDHKNLYDKIVKLQRGEIGVLEVYGLANKIRNDELALIDIITDLEFPFKETQKTIKIPKCVLKD